MQPRARPQDSGVFSTFPPAPSQDDLDASPVARGFSRTTRLISTIRSTRRVTLVVSATSALSRVSGRRGEVDEGVEGDWEDVGYLTCQRSRAESPLSL
jgi:hypothetical protein